MVEIVNPRPYLNSLVGQKVVVRLKWGLEYSGQLVSTDAYMNLHLANTEEVHGTTSSFLGEVFIRCNNVLRKFHVLTQDIRGATDTLETQPAAAPEDSAPVQESVPA